MPDPFDSPASVLNATEIFREELSPDLIIVRVRSDGGEVPEFEPGQFATLGLPAPPELVPPASQMPEAEHRRGREGRVRLVRRAYSIASASTVRDYFEFYLVLVPEGKLTPRLWKINAGGRLWMDTKIGGHFTLEKIQRDKVIVMISTGTGLAPYLSMLRTYRGQNRWRAVVIHGTRIAADLGYRGELEQLAREDPTIIYLPTVTREPEASSWAGMRGRVQSLLSDEIYQRHVGVPLDPALTEVMLCGNPAMIGEVESLLATRDFVTATREQPGNIHFERYW